MKQVDLWSIFFQLSKENLMEQQFTQESLKKIVFFSSPILNNEARRGGSSSSVCFRGIVLLFDSSTENGVLQLKFDRNVTKIDLFHYSILFFSSCKWVLHFWMKTYSSAESESFIWSFGNVALFIFLMFYSF